MRLILSIALVAFWFMGRGWWADFASIGVVYLVVRQRYRILTAVDVHRFYRACGLICRGRGEGVWREETELAI